MSVNSAAPCKSPLLIFCCRVAILAQELVPRCSAVLAASVGKGQPAQEPV